MIYCRIYIDAKRIYSTYYFATLLLCRCTNHIIETFTVLSGCGFVMASKFLLILPTEVCKLCVGWRSTILVTFTSLGILNCMTQSWIREQDCRVEAEDSGNRWEDSLRDKWNKYFDIIRYRYPFLIASSSSFLPLSPKDELSNHSVWTLWENFMNHRVSILMLIS